MKRVGIRGTCFKSRARIPLRYIRATALSRTALPKLHADEVTVRHIKKTGNLPDKVLFMRTRMAIGKSNLP